ncbi:MAG: PAS domain S-box protein [Anaerolineae bacterium]
MILASMCVAMFTLFVLDLFADQQNNPFYIGWLITDLIILGLFAATFLVNRRGHVRWAGYVTIALLVLSTSVLLPLDTMNDSLIIYALPIALASFLLFPAAAFLVFLLVAIIYTGANALALTSSVFNFLGLMGLLILALVLWLIADWLQHTLHQAQTAEAELRQDIAERQRAEQALSASELRFRSLVQNLGEGIVVADITERIMFANPAAERIFGVAPGTLVGRSLLDFVAPSTADSLMAETQRHLRGEASTYELTITQPSGERRYLQVTASPQLDAAGNYESTLGIFHDVTERHLAEEQIRQLNRDLEQRVADRTAALAAANRDLEREVAERAQVQQALRESEGRLRAVAEASPVPLLITRLSDTAVLETNTPLAELVGIPREQLIGQLARQYMASQRDFREIVVQVHRHGFVHQREVQLRRGDGTLLWVAASMQPVVYDGELAMVTGFYDLTTRRQVEQAMRDSEERFRQLAENIREVFWMSSPDKARMLYVSPAYEDMWGRTCESLYANPRSFADAVHPDDQAVTADYWARQLRGEAAFAEYRIVRPDGSIGWIWDRAFPVRDDTGRVVRIVGVAEDVTSRKQAEEELRRALAQEQELSELKSRFISMTSHEFRTPLTGILSAAELLEHYGPRWTEDKRLRYLHQIQASVSNLTKLLDDVLIIGRTDAGRLPFAPVPLDLDRLCADLTEEVQLSTQQHTIIYTAPADLGLVHMDPKHLRHILTNLLSNAVKYSPQGGSIEFAVERQAGETTFRISDHGIGIPEAARERLFETFHRASNVGDIPGTGLGLAIVKRSVDLHGGTIVYTSEPGQGTTVLVTLPSPDAQSEE